MSPVQRLQSLGRRAGDRFFVRGAIRTSQAPRFKFGTEDTTWTAHPNTIHGFSVAQYMTVRVLNTHDYLHLSMRGRVRGGAV